MSATILCAPCAVLAAGCPASNGMADAAAPPADLRGPVVVEQSRYEADLALIARPRPPGSAGWQAVQDLCYSRLQSLGYATTRSPYATGVNVLGVRTGTVEPDKQVIVSAHYDHIQGCPGADDNGSGMAGLLEAARVLAAAPHDRTLVIACWDEEERGLIGSKAYAAAARARGDQIELAIVFEMIGYKSDAPNSQQLPAGLDILFPAQVAHIQANQQRGDFLAVVFDDQAAGQAAAARMTAAAGAIGLSVESLPVPFALRNESALGDLRRSDHASFWLHSFPAMFLTDTANFRNPYYHCGAGPDTADHLDAAFATKVVAVAVAGAEAMLKKP